MVYHQTFSNRTRIFLIICSFYVCRTKSISIIYLKNLYASLFLNFKRDFVFLTNTNAIFL